MIRQTCTTGNEVSDTMSSATGGLVADRSLPTCLNHKLYWKKQSSNDKYLSTKISNFIWPNGARFPKASACFGGPMVKTILSQGNTRLIALMCEGEQDLGNISKCFYKEFYTPHRCPYAAQFQAPQIQMLMTIEKPEPAPRPCWVQGINGGEALPKGLPPGNPYRKYPHSCNTCLSAGKESKLRLEDIYYYDFAIVGECGNVDMCLDDFLYVMKLREVESYSTYMSRDELRSIMQQWRESTVSSYEPFQR